jgi:hypothetical protein
LNSCLTRCKCTPPGATHLEEVTTSGTAVQSVAAASVKQHESLYLEIVLLPVGKEDLDLQPAYQRGLVWDKKMACRLVVTALEERVLPAVFLEEGGCQQRYKHSMHLVSACTSQQLRRFLLCKFRVLTSKYACWVCTQVSSLLSPQSGASLCMADYHHSCLQC